MTGEMVKGAVEFSDRLVNMVEFSGLPLGTKRRFLQLIDQVIDDYTDNAKESLCDLFDTTQRDITLAIRALRSSRGCDII